MHPSDQSDSVLFSLAMANTWKGWESWGHDRWEWSDNQSYGTSWQRPKSPEAAPALVQPSPIPVPASFQSDATFFDRQVMHGHQLYRCVQATPWSVKHNLAGRSVDSLRVAELARGGLNEYSMRLLSEGTFQGLTFTRSISESVLVANCLKGLRNMQVNVDEVATACHDGPVPDKHKESAKFMAPLVEELLEVVKSHVPQPAQAATKELERAKRKLAEAGLELTPVKAPRRSGASSSAKSKPSSTDKTADVELPTAETDPDCGDSQRDLLNDRVRTVGIQPTGHKDEEIDAWASGCANVLSCSEEDFRAHLDSVRKSLKKHSSKPELVAAAKRFGLDPSLASRLNMRNLSAVIAVCQYQSA